MYYYKRPNAYIEMYEKSGTGVFVYDNDPHYSEIEAYLEEYPESLLIEPPPAQPTDIQLEAQAEAQRQQLFANYDLAIKMLSRAQRLGDATAAAKIVQWDEYAVALQAMNDEPDWYRNPQWPEKPE